MELARNADSWIPPDELGARLPPYLPTFGTELFINEQHRFYATCPIGVDALISVGTPGWLRREDALKLYELAFHVDGDILEIGSFHGLSTSILAQAARDSKADKRVMAVDISPDHVSATEATLKARGLDRLAAVTCGDARQVARRISQSGARFGLVFVDHSHAYDDVLDICLVLADLMKVGGFCLFHDFNDARNYEPTRSDYGVSQAVFDGLDPQNYEFYGIFGCTGLYRRIR